MNAAVLMLCLTGPATVGQDTVFKEGKIEVKTESRFGKTYSYVLYNRIYMGRQYHKSTTEPDLPLLPTTYFHDKGPIGIILKDAKWFPEKGAPPVAVLGMDVGTLAAYAKPGQTFHFTERVPTFVRLSNPEKGEAPLFTFVKDAKDRGADVKIFEGEPRETIEKHGKDKFYKVIVVESYKMPVIEVHKELMTKEALQMLMSKCREDGIVAFHTSNRYYQLTPIIASAANELKLACVVGHDGHSREPNDDFRYSSEWIMVARDAKHLAHLKKDAGNDIDWHAPRYEITIAGKHIKEDVGKKFLWTDKGEQSLRGLYMSDPSVEKFNDVLYDLENIVNKSGFQTFRYTQSLHNAVHSWARASADRLNQGSDKKMPEKK